MNYAEPILLTVLVVLSFAAVLKLEARRRAAEVARLKAEHEKTVTESMAAAYLEGARRTAIHASKSKPTGRGLSALITCL